MHKILFFVILIYSSLTFAKSKTAISEYSILIDEDWNSVMFIYRSIDNDETGEIITKMKLVNTIKNIKKNYLIKNESI